MASRKSITVKELSKESHKDLDETLLFLWNSGLEYVTDPSDKVIGSDIKIARRALGIPNRRDLKSIKYWQSLFKMKKDEFSELLSELGITVSNASKTLPKGSIKKLKVEVRKKNIPEISFIERSTEREVVQSKTLFEWQIIGREREVRMLSYEDVLSIHWALVEDFAKHQDPIVPPGVSSENLLHSALFRLQTAIGGKLKYPTVEMAAAALLHSIVHDHPFHKGNKRTSLVSMLVFLDENGLILTCDENILFKFVIQLAQHRIVKSYEDNFADREVLAVSEWIFNNSHEIEKGERPVPFRKLRQILSGYECIMEYGTRGSKVNIQRTVEKVGFLGKKETLNLKTQIYYVGEGREVERHTINKIWADLQLDEESGVDSAAFYGRLTSQINDFITLYRKTLERLAKL